LYQRFTNCGVVWYIVVYWRVL